jgi:hypothetical protein
VDLQAIFTGWGQFVYGKRGLTVKMAGHQAYDYFLRPRYTM